MALTSHIQRKLTSTLMETDRLLIGWWLVNALLFAHVVVSQPPLWVTYGYNGLLYVLGAGISYVDRTVRHVFVLATTAGVVQLGADHFLVAVTGTLAYPESLPMLLSSPAYMPLAWAIVVTQLGYVAIRLAEVHGRAAAHVVPSIVAMGLIGIYEAGARIAGIWAYVDAPLLMLGHVPAYIVIAEGLMFATLVCFVRRSSPIIGGVGFGVLIGVCYAGSFYLFDWLGTL